ncbi:MAG: DUF177 domain-containing protein [Deltaproteobacteria bacterium]|nr:DUF177 domain-containing protein [Deltaproteobacteria bacterium]
MIIKVDHLSDEGLEKDFTEKDDWVPEKLHFVLQEKYLAQDPVKGHFSLQKTMENLLLRADIQLVIHAICDRCTNEYQYEMKMHCDRLLTPLSSIEMNVPKEEQELELSQEDLDFSAFKGNEIDVGEIIAEQVLLDLPIHYYCKPSCKGLCSHCGINLNDQTCHCRQQDLAESPFSVLKDWKSSKKK